jgi:hypothetical protein
LRAFTFGHVRQLDWLLGHSVKRAWQAGAGPGDTRLVVDVDSFVGEVCGRLKRGAAYGYTKLLGYHPILATRADTREVLHIRMRKGSANTQKRMLRFCQELAARVNRAGATGEKLLSRSATRMGARAIDLVIRRLAAEAGLELSAHVLRHTYVTNLIRSGADVVMVAEIAGHRRLDPRAATACRRRPTRTRRWKPSSSRPDGPAGRLERAWPLAAIGRGTAAPVELTG